MDEETNDDDSADSISELKREIYRDGAKTALQSIGGFVANLIDAGRYKFTRNIQLGAYNQRLLEKWLKDSANKGQLQSPPPEFAIPLLEDMSIRNDKDPIAIMEASLLAAACDSKNIEAAHPDFISVLKKIAVAEVIVLKKFNINESNKSLFFYSKNFRKIQNHENPEVARELEYEYGKRYSLFDLGGVPRKDLIDVYVSHLESMGLVRRVQALPKIDIEDVYEKTGTPTSSTFLDAHVDRRGRKNLARFKVICLSG